MAYGTGSEFDFRLQLRLISFGQNSIKKYEDTISGVSVE